MSEKYFMGLDIGTGSVGWAVTDKEYKIVRKHGKSLWGVRLFDSAKTAEERRTFRTSRRRLDRRGWRVELLQALLESEIIKVDSGFYHRLKESKYLPEDKRDEQGICPLLPYALFVDKDYTDKDYYKQFPTIYHLRKYLMTTEETPDIRLVYLALQHLMKHRGHFLFSGNLNSIRNFENVFCQLLNSIQVEELDFNLDVDEENIRIIEECLKDKNITRSGKKTNIIKMLKASTPCEKAFCGLITGNTVKLSDLFGDKELDALEKNKICFSDVSYDDNSGIYEVQLGEIYYIIAQAKAVYDWSVLADILGEYSTISEAKIATYDKHKQDLAYLKKLVRENLGNCAYKEIFVKTNEKVANYSAYIGMTKRNGKKVQLEGKVCTREEFYAFLRKNVIMQLDDTKTSYLREEIEKGTFLPKLVTTDNGVIPNQVHYDELSKILENLKDRLPILSENEEKIKQIFKFRIPYYVGALNGVKKGTGKTNWAVRKSQEKIYPWNFEEVIDVEQSAENFIKRMTSKCTYLINEDVLPKNSLLYSKFVVLNELNNLCINREPISVELKQKIYTELFQRNRKVTQKKLRDFLWREGIAEKTVEITGIDGDFKGSLTAYHDFKEKLTGVDLGEKEKENIVLNITLFGDDKKLLNKRLEKLYPKMTEKQRKEICNLSYSGWGRLSSKFLEGITAPDLETGEAWSIIRYMWETNNNLMQLLSDKYLFKDAIETENGSNDTDNITYEMVNELYVSPAVKRQIWQSLQVVKELCKVMGNVPERLFIEMAREKQESKRTESRKRELLDLYKKCKDEERDWITQLENVEEHILRRDKLYLYYTQKGRCMYSGEIIELEDLWDNQKYDIDHIYPQSKVMDDSLNNRVLVKKTYNANKTDTYPIQKSIRDKMAPFWKTLVDGGFISKEKYKRLIRSTEFESGELVGFIERQLVETRQGTKAVASILKQCMPETEIVYVKANTVSKFRQDFELIKVRELNDLHHAKDAYLNIVVGNTYHLKFTKNAMRFVKENPGRTYNLKKMFTSDKDVSYNGEIAWKHGDNGTISTIKGVYKKNDILVTRRSYQVKGGLFDQQLMKKGKGQVPIKSSDDRLCNIEKYGGYNKATGTYYMLVESEDKKNNKIRSIEYVPLYLKEQFEQKEEYAIQYFATERGLKNPRIVMKCIKNDTLFKVDGFYMWLSKRQNNQLGFKGANQLLLNDNEQKALKKVLKFVNRQKENKDVKIIPNDEITNSDLLMLYDTFLNKLEHTVYNVRLSSQVDTLANKRETFCELGMEEKCIVLSEILHMFQCQSSLANLKLIGGPASAGDILILNKISKYSQVSIINQSITGIFQQEIDLLTV